LASLDSRPEVVGVDDRDVERRGGGCRYERGGVAIAGGVGERMRELLGIPATAPVSGRVRDGGRPALRCRPGVL